MPPPQIAESREPHLQFLPGQVVAGENVTLMLGVQKWHLSVQVRCNRASLVSGAAIDSDAIHPELPRTLPCQRNG